MKILIFLIILSIQFQSTQYVAPILLFGLMFWSIIQNMSKTGAIRKRGFFLLLLWILMILLMIRPSFITLNETIVEVIWLLLGAITFIIISTFNLINRKSAIKTILYAGVFGGVINILSHIVDWYPKYIINPPYAGTRWVGGFDGPNEFGAFYVMILGLLLGMYLEKQVKILPTIIFSSLFLTLIYFSFSRGALLGLAGIMVIFIGYSFIKSTNKKYYIAFFGIVTVGLVLLLPSLINKFNEIRSGASDRDQILNESIRLWSEKPVFGHGLGSFDGLAEVHNTTPHSDYLLFLVSGGLVGISLLLYFYSKFTLTAFKLKYYPELFMLLVFLSQALTFNNIVRGRISILFWIIVISIYLGRNTKIRETVQDT